MTPIILGSTSIFRKALLDKFNIDFVCAKPNIDETALPDETPQQLVARLAEQKAKAVSHEFEQGLIIGSDQVAVCEDNILGKPHNFDNAVKQLTSFSSKTVTFYTGLCLFNAKTKNSQVLIEPFQVHFRHLTYEDICQYLQAEQPYNCAGSFKSEGLGICLFEKLEGDDPNTLIGLPLIQLFKLLKNEGFNVLDQQKK